MGMPVECRHRPVRRITWALALFFCAEEKQKTGQPQQKDKSGQQTTEVQRDLDTISGPWSDSPALATSHQVERAGVGFRGETGAAVFRFGHVCPLSSLR